MITSVNRWLARFRLVLALCLALPLLAAFSAPAQAAGCYGADCDNRGPSANGCMSDDKVIAQGGGGMVELRYSSACKAFFAYSPYGGDTFDSEIHLEMRKKVDGQWKVLKRIKTIHEASPGWTADWTNMLGARTSKYQFRAIWHSPHSYTTWYSPWAVGGKR